MKKASIYCPASISLLFKACKSKNPLQSGSIGIGFTVDQGVTVSVCAFSVNEILFNGIPITFPTVLSVIKSLAPNPVIVDIKTSLPLGCGFGLSGACALSCAYGINIVYNQRLSKEKIAEIAHMAEIENNTGLGTVGTQFTGGFLVKTAPGFPVKAYSLGFIGKSVYTTVINPLSTSSILTDNKKITDINQAADRALTRVKRKSTIEEILDISYAYASDAHLFSDPVMKEIADEIRSSGGHASMAMLGQVIVSDRMPSAKSYPVKKFTITDDTVKIL